ncbi:MAG: AtpZ/AtpI family protein [Rhizobiales bacterium]|nr:AtpZ/AtpI family protein [Hyphomicrobiales bacterium]
MPGRNTEDDDPALRDRLERLSQSLDRHRAEQDAEAARREGSPATSSAMNLGLRAMSEFVAAVVVGGLLGYGLDVWLATSPLMLIAFLAIGAVAGFWGIYRIAARSAPKGPQGGA